MVGGVAILAEGSRPLEVWARLLMVRPAMLPVPTKLVPAPLQVKAASNELSGLIVRAPVVATVVLAKLNLLPDSTTLLVEVGTLACPLTLPKLLDDKDLTPLVPPSRVMVPPEARIEAPWSQTP